MQRNNIPVAGTNPDNPRLSSLRATGQPLPRLLSVLEAANHLGISKSWLQKSRVYGTGPTATVIGRRILYDLRDVETWLATRKQRDTSQEVGPDA